VRRKIPDPLHKTNQGNSRRRKLLIYIYTTSPRQSVNRLHQAVDKDSAHEVLSSGVPKQFGAHSTRHAATSAAFEQGENLKIHPKSSGLVGKIPNLC